MLQTSMNCSKEKCKKNERKEGQNSSTMMWGTGHVIQKMISSRYCCLRCFYNRLNPGLDFVLHILLLRFGWVFVERVDTWSDMLCVVILLGLYLSHWNWQDDFFNSIMLHKTLKLKKGLILFLHPCVFRLWKQNASFVCYEIEIMFD